MNNSVPFPRAPEDIADIARAQLSRAFPRVPARIIVAVLDAYRTITPNWPAAIAAARARLADACTAA